MASGDTERHIGSVLIANRGEIAVRIARTARRLGIRTIGVFSDPDANALHVDAVDSAVRIGGASASDSYLRGDAILAAAQRTGADAVHPGYGFLAENADFAQAVIDAGLIWVGPPPDQIRLLGDKIAAKRAAVEAGVPTTAALLVESDGSYDREALPPMPVLVKAAAGGGGRGMRIVRDADELPLAIESASREAGAAFGDGTVFIEPYLQRGRHVEVQVFGDSQGNVVHLGERECSIQRRNQKVIEEAPSPGIDDATRQRLCAGAVALAADVGYVGAGTVEFMVADATGDGRDDGEPVVTFLEVNTRLQVEHPVTESITGLDLVEWQLIVAAGRRLPASQSDIDARLARGLHAIEARLVAEDPADDWMPSTGRIDVFEVGGSGLVRVDSGCRGGSEVSSNYDSLIAKVISVGTSRAAAAGVLSAALRSTMIVGVRTNADMLATTLVEPDFLAGNTYTTYLDEHPLVDLESAIVEVLVMAVTFADEHRNRLLDPVTGFAPSGWRNLAVMGQRRTWVRNVGPEPEQHHIEYRRAAGRATVLLGPPPAVGDDGVLEVDQRTGREVGVDVRQLDGPKFEVVIELDGIRRRVVTVVDDDTVAASCAAGTIVWHRMPRFRDHDVVAATDGPICPLPGTVIAVHVSDGDQVQAGDLLMVVEAMKMEHQITAAAPSTVSHVRFATGDRVDAGDLLVELTPVDGSADVDGRE